MAKVASYYGGRGNYTTPIYHPLAMGPQSQNATEALMQGTVRTAGTFSNSYCRIFSNATGATSTIRIRVGGASVNGVVSIAGGATGEFEDVTNSDAVVAGNLINLLLTEGSSSSFRPTVMGATFAATSNTVGRFSTGPQTISTASTTFYPTWEDAATPVSTEAAAIQFKMKTGGTLKNFNINSQTNARGTTSTAGSRKGGVNGNLSISIGAGVTGQLEDTSNSDTLASGDLVNLFVTLGTGAGNLVYWCMAEFETTDSTAQLICGNASARLANTTYYQVLMGTQNLAWSTESDTQASLTYAATLSQVEVYVSANTVSAASTMRSRVGAVNGNINISITASTTGWFEDTSNSDSLTGANDVNYSFVMGATGTSATTAMIGAILTVAGGASSIKTIQGLAKASNKTIEGLALASVKTVQGLA